VITSVNSGSGLTRTALVRPFTNFSTLDVVAVVSAQDRPDHGGGG